jgi:hypothetical protein
MAVAALRLGIRIGIYDDRFLTIERKAHTDGTLIVPGPVARRVLGRISAPEIYERW